MSRELRAEKPGETRPTRRQDVLWAQGLLAYMRNALLAQVLPESRVPHLTTVFGGFVGSGEFAATDGYREAAWGDEPVLTLLFKSWSHTTHADEIIQISNDLRARGIDPATVTEPNVSIYVANMESTEPALVMQGFAYPVPAERADEALGIYNSVRAFKPNTEPISSLDRGPEAGPETLFVVRVLSAEIQGERYREGVHVGEGHPEIPLNELAQFRWLPQLDRDPRTNETRRAPLNIPSMIGWLAASGYQPQLVDMGIDGGSYLGPAV